MNASTVVSLLWLAMYASVNVHAENRPQTEFLLPLKVYADHLIVVQGGLGEFGERNLLIDTGAYPSAIDWGMAQKLKLKVKQGQSRALGANVAAGATLVPQVEVGPLRAQNLPVVVEDLSRLSAELGIRVDALIGMDVLARSSFRIDYLDKEVAFGAPTQLAYSTPIEPRKAMACVGMQVSGRVVHLLVDTGAARTVLFAERVPWLAGQPVMGKSYHGLAGRLVLAPVNAKELRLGEVKISAEDVFVSDVTNMREYPFDGVMATWGAHFTRVAFDFEHDVFSWEMERKAAPRQSSARSVLTATSQPSQPEIGVAALPGGSGEDTNRDSLTGAGLESH
jgi:predicted aspartyl protease